MRILLFAGLAEAVGRRQVDLPAGGSAGGSAGSVAELEVALRENFPVLADKRFRVAVNQAYVGPGHVLHESDEVALIPPVSGG